MAKVEWLNCSTEVGVRGSQARVQQPPNPSAACFTVFISFESNMRLLYFVSLPSGASLKVEVPMYTLDCFLSKLEVGYCGQHHHACVVGSSLSSILMVGLLAGSLMVQPREGTCTCSPA